MKTITMLEFRRNAQAIIKRAIGGQRMLLTYRGKPVVRLEPVVDDESATADDPFYALSDLAAKGGRSLTNTQIDKIVYED